MSPSQITPKNFGLMSHTQPNGMCYSQISNRILNIRRNGTDYQNWACTYGGVDCIQNIIHEKCALLLFYGKMLRIVFSLRI